MIDKFNEIIFHVNVDLSAHELIFLAARRGQRLGALMVSKSTPCAIVIEGTSHLYTGKQRRKVSWVPTAVIRIVEQMVTVGD